MLGLIFLPGPGKVRLEYRMRTFHGKRPLITRWHSRRETTGWISQLNGVFSWTWVVDRELGLVAVDGHEAGAAIDCDGDLFPGVVRVGEGELSL